MSLIRRDDAGHWLRARLAEGSQRTLNGPKGASEVAMGNVAAGRYLATRILGDSLTIIVLGIAGSGLDQDIRAVASRCPRVLQRQSDAAGALPAFYRVVRDDNCLRERVLSPTRE